MPTGGASAVERLDVVGDVGVQPVEHPSQVLEVLPSESGAELAIVD